jgi:glycerol-3-phosphate dehydrogenase
MEIICEEVEGVDMLSVSKCGPGSEYVVAYAKDAGPAGRARTAQGDAERGGGRRG